MEEDRKGNIPPISQHYRSNIRIRIGLRRPRIPCTGNGGLVELKYIFLKWSIKLVILNIRGDGNKSWTSKLLIIKVLNVWLMCRNYKCFSTCLSKQKLVERSQSGNQTVVLRGEPPDLLALIKEVYYFSYLFTIISEITLYNTSMLT